MPDTQPNLIYLEELAVQDVIDARRNRELAAWREQQAQQRLDQIRQARGYAKAVQRQADDRRRRSVLRLLTWIPGMAATGELLRRVASQHRIVTWAAGTGVVAAATATAITLTPAITPSGDDRGEHHRPAAAPASPTPPPTPAPYPSSPPPTPLPSGPGGSPTMLPELIPTTPAPHRHTPRPRQPAPVPTAGPLAGQGPPSGVPAPPGRSRHCAPRTRFPVDLPPVVCRRR